jgi:hypothetical protein
MFHSHYYNPYQFQNNQITILHKIITTKYLLTFTIPNNQYNTAICFNHTHYYYPNQF